MNKKRREEIKNKLNSLPLWKLTIFSSRIEERLVDLKKQGVKSDTKRGGRTFDDTRQLRSIYRQVLLDKLILWKNKQLFNDKEGITYADTINFDKDVVIE